MRVPTTMKSRILALLALLVIVAIVALWFKWFPALAQRDRLQPDAPPHRV